MNLYQEAISKFEDLFARAKKSNLKEPTAVALATSTPDGRPSVRMVLLKDFDENGFVFFTNLGSRKGTQLKDNPQAALCFHWQPLEEQVLVEGSITSVTSEEADAYWKTRPLESQIGAWTSHQSQPLQNRKELEDRFQKYKTQFGEGPIPRPPHWSGFRLVPERIEFWKAMPFRLHERTLYSKAGNVWTKTLLNP